MGGIEAVGDVFSGQHRNRDSLDPGIASESVSAHQLDIAMPAHLRVQLR